MASRFYLPNGGTVPTISPPFFSGGGFTPAPIRVDMATTKQDTALATKAFSLSASGGTSFSSKGNQQFVGPSMSAQTISGTFSLVLKTSDVDTLDTYADPVVKPFTYVHIEVYTSANVLRGVLFAGPTATAPSVTADVATQGWATTLETRIYPATALTSLAVLDGDRLIVTIGRRGDYSDTHNFSFVWGDPSATADHTLSAGQTMVGVPWIEFSGDLFGAAGPVTLAASGTVAAVATTSGNPTAVTSAQTLAASGTIPVVTTASGDATRVLLALPATGTAAVVSTTSGDATRTPLVLPVSGTTPATTATAGNPARVPLVLAVSGTIPATSAVAGNPTVVGGPGAASGTITAVTTTSGAVTRVPLVLAASGTVPVVATSSGDPTRTPLTLPASGTVTAVTTTTGDPTQRVPLVLSASGTVDVIATTLGQATRVLLTFAASGTIPVVTFTSGAVFNTSSQTDITVTATLDPRRWQAHLEPRRWAGHL